MSNRSAFDSIIKVDGSQIADPPAFHEPILLSSAQARKKLGLSERGLRDLLRRGLPHIIVGRRKMFPSNDIATWISEQAQACTNYIGAKVRRCRRGVGRN